MGFELDPYNILGVSPSSTATEIKDAYRRAARRLHPDKNPNPGAGVQFQDISVAYELLSDPDRRREYDEYAAQHRGQDLLFTLRVLPSKRAILFLDEPQVVYLLAEILPDLRAQEQHRQQQPRMNLTLVLDRSNSMKGARLDKVKVAAHQIIDQLSENDVLSVITFNDRAEVLIEATTVTDKSALKARVSMMGASGGTEIYQGLSAGVDQNRRFFAPRLVNHIILLTDGHTFGDHERSIKLARMAAQEGMTISAMGLGHEWNDEFLDQLATTTGGTSKFISSSSAVVRFLNDHVRTLSRAFAERMYISVAPDPDVRLEYAFRLLPSPQPLPITEGNIPLGSLQVNRPMSILFQFELDANLEVGFRSIARLLATGDILENKPQKYMALSDISLEIVETPTHEEPPTAILDALGKLTLYRMQERAQEALERGDVREATRRLQNLATRLFEMGEEELAMQAKSEAERVAKTSVLSNEGRKTLKYQTRHLLLGPGS